MEKVRDVLAALGFVDEAHAQVCVAIREGKWWRHHALDTIGDTPVSSLNEAYVATGRFTPGTVKDFEGRREANLVDTLYIPLDFDITGFLEGIDREELYRSRDGVVDGYITLLADRAREELALCRVEPTALINTGYGIVALIAVPEERRSETSLMKLVNSSLVDSINTNSRRSLADPGVKDAGTRIVRIPGTWNTKAGERARQIRLMAVNASARLPESFLVQIGGIGQSRRTTPQHARAFSTDTAEGISNPHSPGTIIEHPNAPLETVRDQRRLLSPQEIARLREIISPLWSEGTRHGMSLGVAGMMAKSGVAWDQIDDFIGDLATGDSEWRDRVRSVETTRRRIEEHADVSGYTKLQSLGVSPLALDAISDVLSPMHAIDATWRVIDDGGENAASKPAFTSRELIGWFADYCEWVRPTTNACDAFHFAASLTMAGVMMGRRFSLWAEGSRQFPLLHTVLVGKTGRSFKDTTINRARMLFTEGGNVDGFYSNFHVLYNVSSPQGLASVLNDYGKSLLVLYEMSALFDVGRNDVTSGTLGMLMRLWDAPPFEDVPRSGSPLRVADPTLALVTGIQPHILASEMDVRRIRSGFAGRFLFVHSPDRERLIAPPEPNVFVARGLLRDIHDAVTSIPAGHRFQITESATSWWGDWFREFDRRVRETEDDADLSQRVPAMIHRVALIMAAADGNHVIDDRYLAVAASFVMTCYEETLLSARRWGGNEDGEIEASIERILVLGRCNRQVLSRVLGPRYGTRKVKQTIDALHDMGRLRYPDAAGSVELVMESVRDEG